MTKGPTPRHSKPSKPVTIDLDATDVTPNEKPGAAEQGADQAAAKAVETGNPEKAASPSVQPGPGAKPAASAPEKAGASGKEKPADAAAASPNGPKAGSGAAKAGPAKSETGKTESAKTSSSATESAKSGGAATDASRASSPASGKGGRGGGLGMVASGVIGAVLALGGGYALQAGGVLPAPGAVSVSGAAVETEQSQAVSQRVDELAAQFEGLMAELSAQPAGDNGGAMLDLVSRIESLEASSSTPSGGAFDEGQSSALAARIDEFEARLDALAERAAAMQTGSDPALSATVAELQASLAGVTDGLSQLRTDAEALAGRISALDQTQTKLAERLDERMAMLETRLDEPSQQVDLARAIAASGLKTAIDRGGSFMSELEAFASVAPDDPAVPELRDLAARGVPSRSELIEGFPEAANLAIAAEAPVDPEAGLVDRLMNSALSVVKVRQVGEVEGDTAEAIAARAEARLLDGDLAAALAEWNTLPEASRSAAADFGDALAARTRAEKLVAASLTPGGNTQAGRAESGSSPESAPEAAADAASDTSSEAPAN